MNIVLIGARSVRQGTGPFIAAALKAVGAKVTGIVGTQESTLNLAKAELQSRWDIAARGYTNLLEAIDAERPDAVVICSPWQVHAQQLSVVASSGCHCLVEKPLAWPASEAEVDRLISAFESRGLLLQMVSQWPFTLSAFTQLHGKISEPIEEFTMRLSPISIGSTMIPDAAPHFVSMLQALHGLGDCEDVKLAIENSDNDNSIDRLELSCVYRHAKGATQARLLLRTCPDRPRPAWYQINHLKAERDVDLPDYQQYLVSDGRRCAFEDPLHQVVADFIDSLKRGDLTHGSDLRAAHRNLRQLSFCCDSLVV